jgi:hypothetical protein
VLDANPELEPELDRLAGLVQGVLDGNPVLELERLAGLVQMMLDVNPELELELDRLAGLV